MTSFKVGDYLKAAHHVEQKGRHDEALKYYKYIVLSFPTAPEAAEATRAVQRLEPLVANLPAGAEEVSRASPAGPVQEGHAEAPVGPGSAGGTASAAPVLAAQVLAAPVPAAPVPAAPVPAAPAKAGNGAALPMTESPGAPAKPSGAGDQAAGLPQVVAGPGPAQFRPSASPYRVGRMMAKLVVIAGWVAVVVGILLSLSLVFLLPGIIGVIGGLIMVAQGQATLAQFDASDSARQSLELQKHVAGI